MKTFFKIFSSVALFSALAACEAELPPIVINPDPVFDKTGVYTVNTISIYDQEETVITVSRVHGLSKDVEMTVGIDEALLAEYNTLNGTSYELMPAEYYTIPQTVTLDKTVKEIEVPVVIKPKALVAASGLSKANNYVIPLSITSSSIELDEKGAQTEVILLPSVVEPKLEVIEPEVNSSLSFIKGVPFTQDVVLNATSNFTTVDASKVTYVAVPSAVATFNEVNGTDYELLSEEYYAIKNGVLDVETMNWGTTVTFDCYEMTSDDIYVLPLAMESDAYQVSQKNPIYVLVQLSTLYMWVVDADGLFVSTSGKGSIGVEMNAPISEQQPLNFVVDNSKVAEYNTANGTSYLSLDPSKTTVTAAFIETGAKTGKVSYIVDMSELEYDGEDKYLVPLVLDRTDLFVGTNVEGDVIYVQPFRTLGVEYTKELWGEEKSNRKTKAGILTATNFTGFRPSRGEEKQKYAFQYNEVWADGLIYFNILNETISGYPNRLKLGDFVDRAYDRAAGYDEIVDNGNSYVDTETGIVHIDLMVLDNAYKEQGGFPIQVNMIPVE